MVRLVVDDEAVPVADLLHVDVGAVVGGDRDRPDLVASIAQDPGVEAQPLLDPALPLVHQVAQRHDDQRRDAVAGDQGQRDLGLARTRGLDDDPPASGLLPCLHRGLLIRPQHR